MMKIALAFSLALAAATAAHGAPVMPVWQNDTSANTLSFNDSFGHQVTIGSYSPTGVWSAVPGSISTVLASPPPIGSTLANSVAATTLSASGAVSGVGFLAFLASPPCVGCTTAGTGAFTSMTSNNIISTELPGLSANVEASGIAGHDFLTCTSAATCGLFLYQAPTTTAGALNSTLYLQRNSLALNGGTSSVLPGALFVLNYSGRNDRSWNEGINSALHNQTLGSLGSQDTGGIFGAFKENSTGGGEVGATWGVNHFCVDNQATVNPTFLCQGVESDALVVSGGGTDTNSSRVGLSVNAGVFPPATDAGVHVGTGIQIASVGLATMDRGISYFTGTYGSLITTRGGTVTAAKGIDWTNVTFSGNAFKSTGFTVDQNGNLTALGGTLGAAITNTISFYGAAAVAQRGAGNNAAVPAGGTGTAAGAWDTSAHRDTAIATINEIRATLINLGLMPAT